MFIKTRLLWLLIIPVFFALSIQAKDQVTGAKAIFHSGEGPTVMASSMSDKPKTQKSSQVAKKEKYMGIAYWIDLVDANGKTTRVDPNRTFKSGERIQLIIESNRDGYLYVLNIGSSGNSHILFPNPGVVSNKVIAGLPHSVPFNNYMRLDNNPGEELLLLMLSPSPLGNFAPSTPAYGPLNNQQTQQYIQMAQAKGAKDIVLETDSYGPKPATYVVAPVSALNDKVITMRIKLKHK